MQHLTDPDPFADALDAYLEYGCAKLRLVRDDGYVSQEDMAWYFSTYRDFWAIEKPALKFARGRVLDVGCGPGRVSLYLQRKGLRVTGIDSSPRVAALASARGVRDVHVASVCERLPFKRGEYETVILFGNNLGVCGSRAALVNMLCELHRVTNKRGRILATSRAPGTINRKHRAYWERRLAQRKEFGVTRLRLEFGTSAQAVDWYWIAPSTLLQVAWETGWRIAELFGEESADDGYAVVLEKIGSTQN